MAAQIHISSIGAGDQVNGKVVKNIVSAGEHYVVEFLDGGGVSIPRDATLTVVQHVVMTEA